jgi:acetoin utilization protein AcuC
VFNDPVVAILWLLRQGARVAYVDIDAHHGDGVQKAFYDSDRVLTVSLHESGRYLFPGSGEVGELGSGAGAGYSVNLPLAPSTSDDTYLWALRQVAAPLISAFRPDVLATQLGIDTHADDPLTHLALTSRGFQEAVRELKALSPGRWVAFGGGGYDMSAVARCWTLAFATMAGIKLDDAIPDSYRERYGLHRLHDPTPLLDPGAQARARAFAEARVREVQRLIFPRHGL